MQHIALEGRCFVLSACQYLTRAISRPTMRNRSRATSPTRVLMRGGSVHHRPAGPVLAGPDFDGESILTAELDPDDIARGKFDFDVVGHYARPDIFQLVVNERPMPAIAFTTAD